MGAGFEEFEGVGYGDFDGARGAAGEDGAEGVGWGMDVSLWWVSMMVEVGEEMGEEESGPGGEKLRLTLGLGERRGGG